MKKLRVFIVIIVMVFLFTGCKLDIKGEVCNNFSDIRYNIFEGANSDYLVTMMCGMRENPYEYDGQANKLCEFGVITVIPKNQINTEQVPYKIIINSAEQSGYLEQNPFDHTYMDDIEKIIDGNSSVNIVLNNAENAIILNPVSNEWAIQYQDAVNIALNSLGENLEQFFNKKKFNAECYLKIIYDQNSETNPYFWYFGIIGQNGDNISLIIDVSSGAIITQQGVNIR